ncbi:unnamed protein product, partial [Amoebophrya sp. A120]
EAASSAEEDSTAPPTGLLLQHADFDVWSLGDGDLVSLSATSSSATLRNSSERPAVSWLQKIPLAAQVEHLCLSQQVKLHRHFLDELRVHNVPLFDSKLRNVCDFGCFFRLEDESAQEKPGERPEREEDENSTHCSRGLFGRRSTTKSTKSKIEGLLPFAPWMKLFFAEKEKEHARVQSRRSARGEDAADFEESRSSTSTVTTTIGLPNPLKQIWRCKTVMAEYRNRAGGT